MYAVYDDKEFEKIDFTQVKILFIGFSIVMYIWQMGFDITDPDGYGADRFFNDMLPSMLHQGIDSNIGYFFWRMVDVFNISTIWGGLCMSIALTIVAVLLITDIRPKEYIF